MQSRLKVRFWQSVARAFIPRKLLEFVFLFIIIGLTQAKVNNGFGDFDEIP